MNIRGSLTTVTTMSLKNLLTYTHDISTSQSALISQKWFMWTPSLFILWTRRTVASSLRRHSHFDRAEKSFILRLPWTTRKTHYWHLEGVVGYHGFPPPEVVDSAPGWWLWDVRMCKGFQSQIQIWHRNSVWYSLLKYRYYICIY